MLPNFPTLEACLQQALDVRALRSIREAEFDPAEQLLRIELRRAGFFGRPACGGSVNSP